MLQGAAADCNSAGETHAWFDSRVAHHFPQDRPTGRPVPLLDEVTALVEWPVPVAGSFEEKFLEVPHEALILTMKKNQKYFHLLDSNGKLLPHFITISNIESSNPLVIRDGNERVIRPRLADAMFFWEEDQKVKLENNLETLKNVIYQAKLGSSFEKVERFTQIARALAVHPRLLLADEPTGNLDSATGEEILSLFQELNAAGKTILMVTHNADIAQYAGRTIRLKDGRLEEISR